MVVGEGNPHIRAPAGGDPSSRCHHDTSGRLEHGAQGCTFLGKVLLTKHFREPIALVSSKLFVEDVVMGSEEKLARTIEGFVDKNKPSLIGVLTSGLSEIKGDDVESVVRSLESEVRSKAGKTRIIRVPTPDYQGGLETGYAKAIEAIVSSCEFGVSSSEEKQINILAGSHLTPADFMELREIVESFGMHAVILPDLSALDGSRQGFSPLARGGTTVEEIESLSGAALTIALAVGANSFYALRLLLGAAEAGFFPGVAFYLGTWFPAQYRTRMIAWFMVAIPISSVIGGPISGWLLTLDGVAGIASRSTSRVCGSAVTKSWKAGISRSSRLSSRNR